MNRYSLLLLICGIISFSVSSCKKEKDKDPDPVINNQPVWGDLFSDRGNYTVTMNPSGINPLCATVEFTTKEPCRVQIVIDGALPIKKLYSNFAKVHIIPVLGLYAAKNNSVILNLQNADNVLDADTFYIQTDSIPGIFPTITINQHDPDFSEDGLNYCTLGLTNGVVTKERPIAFDSNGDIRWMMDLSGIVGLCTPQEISADGNILFSNLKSIYEYDFLGFQVRKIEIQGYNVHHDVIQLPNKNYIAAVNKHGTTIVSTTGEINSYEDHLLEIDYVSGSIVNEWDFREVLDVDRFADATNPSGDWLHTNSFWYDASDHSLIVSGRNQAVFKVDWNNNLQWILAPDSGWGNAGRDGNGFDTKPYLLKAIDGSGTPYADDVQRGLMGASDFDWGWGQHAPFIGDNGNLYFFDNGYLRYYQSMPVEFSRAVELEINTTNMTVKQVWQYGKARGSDTYSLIISDVDELPKTGNILFSPGIIGWGAAGSAKVIEIDPITDQVVFEATLNFKNGGSTTWGSFDMVYRVERIPSLYQ